jgi:hypothetical protein
LLSDRPFFEVPPESQVEECSPIKGNSESARASAPARFTRWQVRFDDINNALLGMALSQTISEVLDNG